MNRTSIGLMIVAISVFAALSACTKRADTNKWQTIPVKTEDTRPASSSSPESPASTSPSRGGFRANLPPGFEWPSDQTDLRILREYGSVFVAKDGVKVPGKVRFSDEQAVSDFQSGVAVSSESVGGVMIDLQSSAMKALLEAIDEARATGLSISPRGSDAARRDFRTTVTLWNSRVGPALEHWTRNGRMTAPEAARVRELSPSAQVPEVFKLEDRGLFFSKDLSKSIMFSVAPPGSSQHLTMLALDVVENADPRVRAILAKHGWFQTVRSDLPHFTYLGVEESRLPELGVRKIADSGRPFWVPDI